MKNFLTILFVFISLIGFSQKPLTEYSIEELESEKSKAVAAEDYANAAKFKKAISLQEELKDAVAAEDYDKAASLKAEINNLSSNSGNANKSASANSSSNTASGTAPNMEFVNQVYLWNKSANTVSDLEKDKPEIKTKTSAGWGYAESQSFWVIDGSASSVKVSGEQAEFILNITPGMDPADLFRLIKFEIIDGKRHLPSFKSTAGAWVGGSTKERKDRDVPVSFDKVDDGVYHVIIKRNLSRGEYAFYGLNKMFSFSLTGSVTSNASGSNSEPGFGEQEYSTEHVYTNETAYWFGADFSLFRLTDPKLIGQESTFKKYITAWQRLYNNEIPARKLQSWLRKSHLEDMTGTGQDLYHQYLDPAWIVGVSHFIDESAIQEHLKNYDINNGGIGLVFMVENTDKLAKRMRGYFVWFDMSSRKILQIEKAEGKPSSGGMTSYWGKSFIPATKIYIDKVYKLEYDNYH